MKKRDKVWLWIMIVLIIFNITLHCVYCRDFSLFGVHINYIASILSAFTLGLMVADTPRFKDGQNGKSE